MRKYKTKKAAKGLQDIAVPEQGSNSDILSSVTNGIGAGSSFGVPGLIGGGVLGLANGLFQKNSQDRTNADALKRNAYLKANRQVAGVDASIDQRGQYKQGTKMIEIEGKKTPEIHTDKNFNVKNLGTTPHSKGGDKVIASEGDIVFNTQNSLSKYNKIASAIKSGDKTTLQKEKNKLPEDNSGKHPKGTKKITSDDHYDSYKGKEVVGKNGTKGKLALDGSGTIYYPNGRAKSKDGKMFRINNLPRKAEQLYTVNSYGDKIYNSGKVEATKQATPIKQGDILISNSAPYKAVRSKIKANIAKRDSIQANMFKSQLPTAKPVTANSDGSMSKFFRGGTKIPVAKNIPSSSMRDFLSGGTKFPAITAVKPKSAVGTQDKRISSKVTPVKAPISTPTVKSVVDQTPFAQQGQSRVITPMVVTEPITSITKTANANLPTPVSTTTPTTSAIPGASNPSTLNNIMQLTGVANNLFQGIKSEPKTSEKYFDPELMKYTDRSQSLRNASTQAAALQTSNARNVSGGSSSNLRANQNQAALSNLGRQNAIDEQEMSRRDAIEGQNIGLRNSAEQYNLQRKDAYESQYKADRLRKQEYVDTAAADIGQLGMARQEESYLRSRDDKAEQAQEAGYNSINGRYQHKSRLDGSTYFEPDADTSISRFGTNGGNKKTRTKSSIFAKGTKSVSTSKYKMK